MQTIPEKLMTQCLCYNRSSHDLIPLIKTEKNIIYEESLHKALQGLVYVQLSIFAFPNLIFIIIYCCAIIKYIKDCNNKSDLKSEVPVAVASHVPDAIAVV
jgi:hypothetical protein